jgi:hypothetical protein
MELMFVDAEVLPEDRRLPVGGRLNLVVGDDTEWAETQGQSCMANAACVEWEPRQSSLRILSSIVGLPPIFIYREPGAVAVASELHLLRAITNLRLAVNPQAALELFKFGYPLEHRTLFRDVTVLPGGHILQVGPGARADLIRSWEPPEPRPESNRSLFIDLQAEAFKQAIRRLRLSDTVFSLTGGLDTRAILAALSEAGVKPTAGTISGGRNLCLDARLARALCRAYGLPHVVVALGEQFQRDLPAYVLEASQLSGGLASVLQAHEVYFHRELKGFGSRRLSGYLGNQVGRGGVEGLSTRNADPRVLNGLIGAASIESNEHWLASAARRLGHPLPRLLIQYEVPFSSLGNYSIGHHFMIQQSPYASRSLIEISLGFAPDSRNSSVFEPSRARLRDLRHRFLGQPRRQSFQRKVIEQAGGYAAECPINWGWRARGGISLRGLGWGMLAFVDAAASQRPLVPNFMGHCLRLVGADGLHGIYQYRTWFDTVLREFVEDTLRSRLVTENELFNATAIGNLLDEHYGGVRSHYSTLLATLDLALAQQLFAASP